MNTILKRICGILMGVAMVFNAIAIDAYAFNTRGEYGELQEAGDLEEQSYNETFSHEEDDEEDISSASGEDAAPDITDDRSVPNADQDDNEDKKVAGDENLSDKSDQNAYEDCFDDGTDDLLTESDEAEILGSKSGEEIVISYSTSTGKCGESLTYKMECDVYGKNTSVVTSYHYRLTISGRGEMDDYSSSGSPWENSWGTKNHRVVVEEIRIEEGVTSVSPNAFTHFSPDKLYLPKSLTSIPWNAFSLPSIISAGPRGKSNYDLEYGWTDVIPDNAFRGFPELAEVEIKNQITEIGDSAFAWRIKLQSISIPGSVKKIGNNAFANDPYLSNLIINEGVEYIGEYAFNNCAVQSVAIPGTVKSIGNGAFNSCTSLCSVELEEGLESIGNSSFSMCPIQEIIIPESVISIGDYAFEYSGLNSVSLPPGLDSIGDYAFQCSGLNSVSLPQSLTRLNPGVFRGCAELKSVELPQDLTVIGTSAFEGCRDLDGVAFPDSLVTIGQAAFKGSGVESVAIPENVTTIYGEAFSNCNNLEAVVLPDGITTIGNGAFSNCANLIRINIPQSVREIGTFSGCNNLVSLGPINGNYNVEVDWNGENALSIEDIVKQFPVKVVTMPDGITEIGYKAFEDTSTLKEIHLCDSLTSIGGLAFSNCKSLEHIEIPSGVQMIGYGAFSGCRALTSASIPEGIVSLPSKLFYNCTGLMQVYIPRNLLSVGSDALYNVKKSALTVFYNGPRTVWESDDYSGVRAAFSGSTIKFSEIAFLQNEVSLIKNTQFKLQYETDSPIGDTEVLEWSSEDKSVAEIDTDGVVFAKSIGKTQIHVKTPEGHEAVCVVRVIGNIEGKCGENTYYRIEGKDGEEVLSIFGEGATSDFNSSNAPWEEYKNDIEAIEITKGVTRIGDYAFYECINVKNVNLSLGLTEIGASAFRRCDSLTSITVPEGVRVIEKAAFAENTSFEELIIYGGIISVPYNMCYKCYSLQRVIIPEGVTTIGGNAFFECGLTSFTIPEGVTSIGTGAFSGCSELVSVTIPNSYKSLSFLANTGSHLGTVGPLEGDYDIKIAWNNDIPQYAFSGINELQSVTIPVGVTSIGDEAFKGQRSLQSVNLPEGLKSIGDSAFYECGALTSITIPDGVTSIGEDAFNRCNRLASVKLPEGLTGISRGVFYECTSLTEVTIPEGVTSIGDSAFNDCKNLIAVTIPEGVTSIGEWAFFDCEKLSSLIIPEGVTQIGRCAFLRCENLSNVSIPSSLTYSSFEKNMGGWFENCPKLKTAGPQDGEYNIRFAWVESIPSYAFKGLSQLETIVFPDGVSSIGYDAFYDCVGLTEVSFPEGVKSIGADAFKGCAGLEDVVIPQGITTIGSGAFEGCSGLTNVTIGEGARSIGNSAFCDCVELASVAIPDTLMTIGASAFKGCVKLEDIHFSDNLTSIGDYAFQGCGMLTSIVFPKNKSEMIDPYYEGRITKTDITLGAYCFDNCQNISEIQLGDSVISVPEYCFSNCSALQRIVLPNSLVSVGKWAFFNDTKLADIYMSRVTNSIDHQAISNKSARIHGPAGSYAQSFANEYGYPFVVEDIPVEEISFAQDAYVMEPNSTLRLPFETTPAYYTDEVHWIVDTDDEKYLTVENGTVKSKSNTTPVDHPVEVHVYVGDDMHATCRIHIRRRATSVTLNQTTASVDVGTTLQLTASVGPYNASDKTVVWSSSDETVATVDETGLVRALAKGDCEIRATAADGSAVFGKCDVTVPNDLHMVESVEDFQSPHPYRKGTSDIWIYREEEAESISVTFSDDTKLDNYGYDRIVIRDMNGDLVGEYKKAELAGQTVPVPGNTVWLKLAAAAGSVGSHYGFAVEALDTQQDVRSYVVRFHGNGATGGSMERQKIRRDTNTALRGNTYVKEGFYFTGWNTNAAGTGTSYADGASVRNIAAGGSTITLYAQWMANSYTIRFDANGGSGSMAAMNATYGVQVKLKANTFTRSGYHFTGWNTNKAGNGTGYADEQTVLNLVTEKNGSITLYAQWEIDYCTIRYNANGGTGRMTDDGLSDDHPFTLKPNIFTRTGYHFSHWNTAADGSGDSYDDRETVQGLAEVQGSIVTLYVQWDPNTYAVQYSANGGSGTMEDSDAVYGEGLTLRANTFTRTGYHFTGWNTRSDGNGTAYADQAQVLNLVSVQDGSITLYAQWAVNTYTVRYQANGGSGSMSAMNATYGVSFQLRANTFTRTGYHFTGWNTQADGQGTAYADKAVVRDLIDIHNGTVTMYAQWAANTYTIRYFANGGKGTMADTTAVCGQWVKLRKNTFTWNGYHFVGWNRQPDGQGTSYADEADVLDLATTQGMLTSLYAKWEGNTYTVTFDPGEGDTDSDSKEVVYKKSYGALPQATRPGYTFQGWYTTATGGSQVTAQTTVTKAADHTLYAHWIGEAHTLTFVFGTATPADENGQALSSADQARVKTRQVRYGERYDAYDEYGLWPNALRSGYDFAGWYTASTGGDPVSPTDLFMELQDQSLYPHWTPKTFAVRFNANGTGATVDPAGKNVTYGAAYGELPTPERFGYTFDGWYTLAEGGAKKTESSLVTADEEHTLYAHWTPLEAKVNFEAGEGQTAESFRYVAYDSAYGGSTALPRPVRTGYDFTGWYTASTGGTEVKDATVCKQVEEHTLYARWKAATYTVRFNSLGGSSARQITVTYAGKYGTLPVSTRTGYDFAGWYTAETGGSEVTKDTVVTKAAAHTLYARWNAHAYQIVYDGNGGTGSVEPQDAVYGTEIALAANGYEKTGYHFTGWNTQANGKGTAYTAGAGVTGLVATDGGSITLYAQWAANTYRVTLDARGGELTDNTMDVTYDATYAGLPAEVSRKGYTFTGWYTAAEDGDAVTAATAMTTASDHTLYAHWQPVACVLLFDANGGSVAPESKLVDYETAYGELPTPERKGYRFTGWYTAAENGEAVTAETVANVLEEVTLFACWEARSYNVSFDPGEGIAAIDGRTVTYDQVYGELPVPEKEHYDFVGWFTDSARDVQDGVEVRADTVLAIDSAHTLYARWAPHLYRVVFGLRGGLFDRLESLEYTVPYQSSLADAMTAGLTEGEANALAAEKPVRTKYRFAGWTMDAGPGTALGDTLETVWADPALASVTADHTIYADWTPLYATAAPVISVAEEPAAADGAVIASDTHILLTCAARDARIYYTTNGDEPTADGALYTGEIPAESIAVRIQGAQPGEPGRQVTIRAIAIADGHAESAATATVYKLAEDAEDWGDVTAADQAYFAAHGVTGTAADVPAGLWIAPVADQFYTGANITLSAEALRVYDGKRLLTAGTDYSVSCKNNKEPGTATVTVTGKGNYNGSLTGNFTIAKRSQAATKPFAKAVITYDRNVAYNADAAASASGIVPGQTGPVVTYNGVALHEAERDANGDPVNGDYFIVYENNRNAGTATMTVTGIGEYYGMQSKTYTITGTAISRCFFDGFDTTATVYTGQPQTKEVRIYTNQNRQTLLTEAAKNGQGEYLRDANGCYVDGEGRITGDYIISYEKNTDAGTAAMIVTGIGNYTGTWKKTWSIKAYDLKTDPEHRIRVTDETGAAWPAAAPYKETAYAKGGAKPEPVVWFATAFEEDGVTPETERQLTAGVDYTLSWMNNTAVNDGSNAAKLPTVKITGKGDLTGIRQDLYFTVTKQSLAAAGADGTPLLTLDAQDVVYKASKKNYTTSFKLYDVNGTALAATDYDAKSVKYYYTEDTDLADGTFRHGGYVLENGVRDWTGSEVQTDDMVPAGTTLRITVDAKEGEKALYTGTAEGTYRIVTGDVGKATVKVANQFYTGREVRPGKEEITVTLSGSTLTPEDYEIVSYENNINKGNAKLTIRGRGDYGGTKTATYSIAVRPMTTTIRYDGNGATAGAMREMKVTTLGTDAKPVCLTDNAYKRTGYTFAGWCRRKSGVAGDADYYATDGSKTDPVDLRLVIPALPEGEGGLITLYAQWIPVKYSITWHTNGGENHPDNLDLRRVTGYADEADALCYNADTPTVALLAPDRAGWPVGYQFSGWYRENTYKNKIAALKQGTTGDLDLWAKWVPYTYQVCFNGNGATNDANGDLMPEEGFSYGVRKALTANKYKRDGYVFLGWSGTRIDPAAPDAAEEIAAAAICADKQPVTEADLGIGRKNNGTTVVTLYAVWQQTFTVTYDTDGGTRAAGDSYADSYRYGQTYRAGGRDYSLPFKLPAPVRAGYGFDGWYGADGKKITQIAKNTTGDLRLTARWTPYAYSVKFDGNGKNSGNMTAQKFVYGQEAPLAHNQYVRNGMVFLGWSVRQTNQGNAAAVQYADGQAIDGSGFAAQLNKNNQSVTLYAVWRRAVLREEFALTYHIRGGETIPDTYRYGTGKAALAAAPAQDGCTFAGWYRDEACKNKVTSISASEAGDIDLWAKWTGGSYTVTFTADAPADVTLTGRMAQQKLTYLTSKALNANGYKVKGYDFLGWSTESATAAAAAGRAAEERQVICADKEAVTGEGLVYTDGNVRTADNAVTLYGVWKKATYHIVYMNMEGVENRNPAEFTIDSPAIDLGEPALMGNTFLGWYSDAACRKQVTQIAAGTAGDQTLYAKWLVHRYTICYDLNDGLFGHHEAVLDTSRMGYITSYDSRTDNGYLLPTARRAGYTFGGWYKEKACRTQVGPVVASPEVDMTVYAKWIKE